VWHAASQGRMVLGEVRRAPCWSAGRGVDQVSSGVLFCCLVAFGDQLFSEVCGRYLVASFDRVECAWDKVGKLNLTSLL